MAQDFEITLQAAEQALSVLSPADRAMRVKMGEALRDHWGDAAFSIWDTWYQQHDRYTLAESKQAWRSFGKGGARRAGIASLVYEAKRAGFKFTATHQDKRSADQRRQFEAERATRRAALAAEAAAEQLAAAARGAALWAAASPDADGHPYLLRKRCGAHGARRAAAWIKEWTNPETGEIREYRHTDALLVPLWSAPGKLASLQAILPGRTIGRGEAARDKDYLPGGRKEGCYFVIGRVKDAAAAVICEGFATGASIHEATGYPVMVTFDAGNMESVAVALRAKLPDIRIAVAADNDQFHDAQKGNPGVRAATAAAKACDGVLVVPEFDDLSGEPTDFNDLAVLQGHEAVARAFEAALNPPEAIEEAAADEAPPFDGDPVEAGAPAPAVEVDDPDVEQPGKNGYFAILGFDHDDYYVFVHGKRQLIGLNSGNMGMTRLMGLAPLNWWEMNFPGDKGKVDSSAAQNFIIQTAHQHGIYDPTRVRGRGAWEDNGRIVFHHGGYLTVDGVETDLSDIESRYVYEMSRSLPALGDVSLTSEEGEELVSLSECFRWATPGSAALLAGWVALAGVCGSVPWRPHLWLTGGAGSGKSTILTKFVHHLMGGVDVYAQGSSTEPGIRQALRTDARPVVLDEAESNEEADIRRVQAILGMIRQASTESGAKVYKGTASGEAMSFDIRSMFCLASIQVALKQRADIDRLSVLVLRSTAEAEREQAGEQWRALRERLHVLHKDKTLPARLLRRAIDLLPITLQNIVVFTDAAADRFGSQRDGDQYGTMLAGTWSLISSQLASREQALELIDRYDWSEHREMSDADESTKALSAIMERHIRISGGIDVTVFELLRCASGVPTDTLEHVKPQAANDFLQRHGMKVKEGHLLLSNTSNELKGLMAGTGFEADLRGALLRVPGATKWVKDGKTRAEKFNGVVAKVVAIPLAPLVGELRAPDTAPF